MTVCYGDASMQIRELHQLHQLKEGKLFLYKDENKFTAILWKSNEIQRVLKST